MRKKEKCIEIDIHIYNKENMSYRYIVKSNMSNRVYNCKDSTKIYRLLERLYNRDYIDRTTTYQI